MASTQQTSFKIFQSIYNAIETILIHILLKLLLQMFFWIRGMYRILNQFRAVLAVAGAARPEAEWALGVAYSATGLVHPFI